MPITLPTQKTLPKMSLRDMTVLVYAAPKFGKSTWASQAPDALFLATEPGLNHLASYQLPISSWEEMLEACALIAKGSHGYRTIVIDTIDNAYQFCENYVCRNQGFAHPSDAGYGKGWSMVKAEFLRVLTKLANLPYGLIMTSHAKTKEVKTPTGPVPRMVPTLTGGALDVAAGLADAYIFGDFEEVTNPETGEILCERVARTKASSGWEAGERTGLMVPVIPFSWPALEAAWKDAKTEQARILGIEMPPEEPAPQQNQPTPTQAA